MPVAGHNAGPAAPSRAATSAQRTLIFGSGEFARRLIEEIERLPRRPYAIIGLVADGPERPRDVGGFPVLGSSAEFGRVLHRYAPTRIIVAVTERRARLPVERLLTAGLQGVIVEDGLELYEHCTGRVEIERLNASEWMMSKRLRQAWHHVCFARALSLVAGVAGLVVLAPVLALIAIAIKLDSPGPVLFVHRRVGLNGVPFPLIKFRSMRPAAQHRSEWAGDNSDRVTRVGRLLRKFWLDELPELVNMVRGDMNLVGPRPHPVANWLLFSMVLRNTPVSGQRIPYCSLRTLVRPGLTGWAQVKYRYANNLEEEVEKVKYDLYYVKYRSVLMDLSVIAATMRLMISGRGTAPLEAVATPQPTRPSQAGEPAQSVRAHG